MMQFFHPNYLHFLWLIPVLASFYYWLWRRKKKMLATFGNRETLNELTHSVSHTKIIWKAVLFLLGIFFLTIALSQPQWGEVKRQIKRKGVDIIFMVDTSLSMLAEDVKPNRLEKSKFLMKAFMDQLKGDRVGIVTFAGTGFLQSPLTLDYSAFSLFANAIFAGYVPDAGTNLSRGLETAIRSFPDSEKKYRALIILSDGESLDGRIEEALKRAKKEKIRIYSIGIGTIDGEPIPLRSKNGKQSGYKKDRQGQIVITKLNEKLLKQIARGTEGLYFTASPSEREVELIYKHLQRIGQQEFKERLIVEREDHFQLFILLGLISLIISNLLSDRKKVYEPVRQSISR